MKVYDISMPISEEIMTYKNNSSKPKIVNTANFDNASHYQTDLTMNLHTGTHIDAPLHMKADGETMEVYDLNRFVTKAKVLDFTDVIGKVSKADLMTKDIKKDDFILLKTRNSSEDFFNMEWISLAIDGAQYLAEIGINGVGIDALGIERDQPSHQTHISLMDKHIIIVEGLRLAEVMEGTYDFIALPIAIKGVEASPTRAILIENL